MFLKSAFYEDWVIQKRLHYPRIVTQELEWPFSHKRPIYIIFSGRVLHYTTLKGLQKIGKLEKINAI